MKRCIIVLIFNCFLMQLSFAQKELDPVKDFENKETIPTEQGLAIKNLLGALRGYSIENPNQTPKSWSDIPHGLDYVNELLGHDVSKDFYFASNHVSVESIDGEIVIVGSRPFAKGPNKGLIRYYIWKDSKGGYYLKSVKEELFEDFLREYKITPVTPSEESTQESQLPIEAHSTEADGSVSSSKPTQTNQSVVVETDAGELQSPPPTKDESGFFSLRVIGVVAVVVLALIAILIRNRKRNL